MSEASTIDVDPNSRLKSRLEGALEQVAGAPSFARSTYQNEVFQIVETMMQSEAGMASLFTLADRFDQSGVFSGGPWEDPSKLQPPLVAASLKGSGIYPIIEILSELRVAAIATGRAESHFSQAEAQTFIDDVMALNLEYLFPGNTEEERMDGGPQREACLLLFSLLGRETNIASLVGRVFEEVEQLCAQRPVMTSRTQRLLDMAERIPNLPNEYTSKFTKYFDARHGRTPLIKQNGAKSAAEYRENILKLAEAELLLEAESFAGMMRHTGLIHQNHAVLLRHLNRNKPELLPIALGLKARGKAELNSQFEFAQVLIRIAILPSTAQCIYGFSRLLEEGLLSRKEVRAGLARLIDLDLQQSVRDDLLERHFHEDAATANSILVAGTISVLGQPLGLGQGNNPTCQAARAISLWAMHAHGYLLSLTVSAARDGFLRFDFEGQTLRSDQLVGGLIKNFDKVLDPVSIILTPHLDTIYAEMMRRVALRSEDGHKWVNPALYGRWIASGFASVFSDLLQTTVARYDDFVRRFYATHHPDFNDGHMMMYPNPIGILVTNNDGDYLGPHAISLVRVQTDDSGVWRAYFFNPNNEGRQNWGAGVEPTVSGYGEKEGESSLPLNQFVSRIYAFHYNPYEEGDAYAVPGSVVESIRTAAKNSWGKAFRWF